MSQDLRAMRAELKPFCQVRADLDKRLGRIKTSSASRPG
jgi:hypothetical protein